MDTTDQQISYQVYDSGYRGACPRETVEPVTGINVISKEFPQVTHIRNEGKRTHSQESRHKAEGMVVGASDIVLPGCPAFVCELKRKDKTKSRVSKEQIDYLEACAASGAFACIAYGHEEALRAFNDWRAVLIKSGYRGIESIE